MGMDNLENFLQWKNPEEILDTANILVYPRLGHSIPDWAKENKKVSIIDTPIIESELLIEEISIDGMCGVY